jgi:hypothetical protein
LHKKKGSNIAIENQLLLQEKAMQCQHPGNSFVNNPKNYITLSL